MKNKIDWIIEDYEFAMISKKELKQQLCETIIKELELQNMEVVRIKKLFGEE